MPLESVGQIRRRRQSARAAKIPINLHSLKVTVKEFAQRPQLGCQADEKVLTMPLGQHSILHGKVQPHLRVRCDQNVVEEPQRLHARKPQHGQ